MREIKFRAWDNTEKKMLSSSESWSKIWWDSDAKEGEDDYNYHSKQLFIDNQGHVLELTDEHGMCDMHYLLQGKPKYDLMQYTGLKDKNGKEIYEGDIVKFKDLHDIIIAEVEWWETGQWGYKPKDWIMGYPVPMTGGNIEVIGNIYENPELLAFS